MSARLSEAFAAALGPFEAEPAAASLIGLEHEYQLWRADQQVDFRDLIHTLALPGRRLDPGDANAYRLPNGLALTCDEAEAEIAAPPTPVNPGFTLLLDGWAVSGQQTLAGVLPASVEVRGYSTHLSLALPEVDQEKVIDLFCRAFAPVLMLVFDRPGGLGVYVRPRPGRLELCGDYVAGAYLRAAATFYAGAVRACLDALAGDAGSIARLPPALGVDLRPATGRFGYYVGRRAALGFDLYAAGREAKLPLLDGGSIIAGEQLQRAWQAARVALISYAAQAELDLVDRIVANELPLGVEVASDAVAGPGQPTPLADGTVPQARQRLELRLEPVAATWAFAVYRLEGPGRTAFACLPRATLASFLQTLDDGELDGTLRAYLASPPQGRRLTRPQQTLAPGLWDELAPPLGLVPAEPDPQTGRYTDESLNVADERAGKPARAGKTRAGKVLLLPPGLGQLVPSPSLPSGPPPRPALKPPRPGPPKALAGAIGVIVAALIAVAAAAGAGVFSHTPEATPSPAPSVTASTPTPTAPTASPLPTSTAPVAVPGTSTPTRTPLPTETNLPASVTPTVASGVATPTPSSTRLPTETPRPTSTPTPCSFQGAICTPTPSLTPTRTPLVPPIT